jgi:hypothetical protein
MLHGNCQPGSVQRLTTRAAISRPVTVGPQHDDPNQGNTGGGDVTDVDFEEVNDKK